MVASATATETAVVVITF